MNKVTTINLNGTAYQLEEAAYDALHKYLDQAAKKLADDPDKEEIVADLERAVAEKCDHYLRSGKNVVTASEVRKIIDDMGPVETPATDVDDAHKSQAEAPKRLYLLRENAMLGGVCTGLAAYFNVDVTVVRLVFILLVFFTSGFWILAYFLLMLVVPEARTPEEKAEAHGETFSAHEVVKKAKQKYADLSDSEHWHRVAEQTKPALSNVGEVVLKITRVLAGIAAAVIAIGVAFLTLGMAIAAWSVIFGHVRFDDQLQTIAKSAVIAAIVCAYLLAFLPMLVVGQLLQTYASKRVLGKQHVWGAAGAFVLWIAALATLITIGLVNGSRVRDYQQSHAYLHVYDSRLCINDAKCNPQPQDQGVHASHEYRMLNGHVVQVY